MSKFSSLSKPLVEKYAISQSDANRFVREMFSTIKDNLETDKVVKVKGLGTFRIVETSARESIDVNTKERILIEARNKISFTPENAVRDRVNSPFAQFDTIEMTAEVDFEAIDKKYEQEIPAEKMETEEKPTEERPMEKEQIKEEPIKEVEEPVEEPVEEVAEEEPEPMVEKKRNYLGLLLVILGILIAFGLGYFLGHSTSHTPIPTEKITQESIQAVEKVEETIGEAVEEPVKDLGDAPAEQALDEVTEAPYNSDPRVKTGAYIIVGLDTTVTVLTGQTLKGISRAYLGDGMECYVEAYNNGLKEVNTGDRVKIPRLRMKDNVRKQLNQHIE